MNGQIIFVKILIIVASVASIVFIMYVVTNDIKVQCQQWTRQYYATHPEYNKNESVYEKCLNTNGISNNIETWENPFEWKIKIPEVDEN